MARNDAAATAELERWLAALERRIGHQDGRADTWTPDTRQAKNAEGVWQ